MRTLVAAGALWVTFVAPADWLCTEREGCVVCRNVSDHSSDVLVHDEAGGFYTRRLEPATELRVCPPQRSAASARPIGAC